MQCKEVTWRRDQKQQGNKKRNEGMRQEENGYQEQERIQLQSRDRENFSRGKLDESLIQGMKWMESFLFRHPLSLPWLLERERKRSLEQNQARVVLFGSILPSLVNGGGVHVTSSLAFLSFLATHVVSFPDSFRYHHWRSVSLPGKMLLQGIQNHSWRLTRIINRTRPVVVWIFCQHKHLLNPFSWPLIERTFTWEVKEHLASRLESSV